MGAFKLHCEREFTPLRWAVRRDRQRHIARLLDDSGDAAAPQVVRIGFEAPTVEEPLKFDQAYEVPSPGGLYVARRGTSCAAVIIPPTDPSFADLQSIIDGRERSVDAVLRAVAVAHTWGSARLPGNLLAAICQRIVLRAVAAHVFHLIGGDIWTAAESSSIGGPGGLTGLKRAISRRREEAGIGAVLVKDCAELSTATREERIRRIASLASRFHLRIPQPRTALPRDGAVVRRGRTTGESYTVWLVELALRLASNPSVVEEWAGELLREGTTHLLKFPTLARAARFLVIATDRHLQSQTAPGELYASWGWA